MSVSGKSLSKRNVRVYLFYIHPVMYGNKGAAYPLVLGNLI